MSKLFPGFNRVGSDERFLGLGGDNLNVDMVLTGEEETLADWEVRKALFLFLGKFEDVREDINRSGRLF